MCVHAVDLVAAQDLITAELQKKNNMTDKLAAQGEQKMRITDRAVDIDQLSMKKVVSYMMWAPPDKVAQAFEAMTLQTKLMFLKRMNIHQYGWFLFAFSDEQWSRMWQKLPTEQQRIIPATRLEQLQMLRDCWRACSGGDVMWYAGGARDPFARDLSLYRDKAMRRLESFKTDNLDKRNMEYRRAIFYQWLHNYFQANKLQLLRSF